MAVKVRDKNNVQSGKWSRDEMAGRELGVTKTSERIVREISGRNEVWLRRVKGISRNRKYNKERV